ncbi:dnaJ homolog subfamily B member 2-like [Notothenia coriiceps]|uniref:DnaJ homolog subfamily B member 2-like n=1 Tax=Notothenia coriiceps TaxID=8208 RepID=A0A6I9Q2L2_9TELE|nr:PREDICTED: dnaJ homolog subfamily B member 2-like [Notothenia coriiceps]
MAVVGGVLVLAMAVACFRHHAQQVANGKLGLGPEGGAETHFDYQELCRQHMASKSSLSRQECMAGVSGGLAGSAIGTGAGGRRGTDTSRVSSVSSQFSDGPQHSPSSTHSSTPSWSEEPAQSNMDISTGHMILVSHWFLFHHEILLCSSPTESKREAYDRHGNDRRPPTGSSSAEFSSDFPGFTFTFRKPDDVFREFFGGQDPFANFFDDFSSFGGTSSRLGPGRFFSFPSAGVNFTSFSSSMGGLDGMDSMGGGMGNFKSVSTSTRIMNGKRTTTKKTKENGQERTEIEEDGVLKTVLINGVQDEMALTLELSRRGDLSRKSPQKPRIQHRSPAECERPRPSPHSAAPHRSFSSAPFYHYGVAAGSEDEEVEDEDLQMALACSLSELDAQQRAATDFISDSDFEAFTS